MIFVRILVQIIPTTRPDILHASSALTFDINLGTLFATLIVTLGTFSRLNFIFYRGIVPVKKLAEYIQRRYVSYHPRVHFDERRNL